MALFGICTSTREVNKLNFEKFSLYEEACKEYDVLLIDPRSVIFKFIRGQHKPSILYNEREISSLKALVVRSTKNRESSVAILVRALKLCGCHIFDPIERFSVGKSSKLLTTISRFQKGIGTSTYICFSKTNAIKLLFDLEEKSQLPLIVKPITGKQGKGIVSINDIKSGLEYIDFYFEDSEFTDEPFFVQNLIVFKKEYRLIILDGKSLGVVEKIKQLNSLTANAAQGAEFVKVDNSDIVEATLKNVSNEGILGVDVAVDTEGYLHIIETNRAPQWKTFEDVTGVNVAKAIVNNIRK